MAAVTTAATPTPSARRGASLLRLWPQALLLALIAGIAALAILSTMITGAIAAYRTSETGLEHDVQAARAQGFTDDDLRPVLTGLATLKAAPSPQVGERLSFYQQQKLTADTLRSQLTSLTTSRLAAYRQQLDEATSSAQSGLDQARSVGVADEDLAASVKTLGEVKTKAASATSAGQLRKLISEISPINAAVDQLAKSQAAENAAIDQATAALKAAHPGDIEGIRKDGQAALTQARNDGVLAGWLKLHQLDRDVARIEAAAGALAGADLDQVARAAATIQVRNNTFHSALVPAMPDKVIEVSINDQHLWAYEHGKVVFETPVTTGRPELPTDTGPMSVLSKDSPWKMHSPWPRGSRWWYPDTVVRKVLWFTATGEGLHDAIWEPNYLYGPGSQNIESIASHGCIHLPGNTVDWMYDWAPVGTPVIVIPGDGSPTAQQLQHDTIDTPAGQTAPHGS